MRSNSHYVQIMSKPSGYVVWGMLFLLFTQQSTVFGVGLVTYYSFDNASDLGNEDTGLGRDLAVHQAAPIGIPEGAVNGAAFFEGDPDADGSGTSLYMLNRFYPQIYPSGDFTVTVWAKATVTPPTTHTTWITRNKNYCGFGIYTNINGVWAAGTAGLYGFSSRNQRINGLEIVVNEWTHLALTFKATGRLNPSDLDHPDDLVYTGIERFYINGNLIGQKPVTYRPRSRDEATAYTDRMGIGYDGVPGGHFTGVIDEFAVYDWVLETSDIAALANKIKTPPLVIQPELIAYYSFDNSGALNVDDSGNGYDLSDVPDDAPSPVTGMADGAADFDGVNDAFHSEDMEALYPDSSFTVVTWARADTVGTDGMLTIPQNIKLGGYTMYTAASTQKWYAGVYYSPDGTSASGYLNTIVGPTVVPGEWVHLAFTYDATEYKLTGGYTGIGTLYINGAPYLSETDMDYRGGNGSLGLFGLGNRPGRTNWYDGTVDEFAVFRGALSEAKVHLLAMNAVTPSEVLSTNSVPTPGDINHDDFVDLADFSHLAADWLYEAVK